MVPRFATQTTASARVAASALASAASASPRDFGASGNAGRAAIVNATGATARSTMALAESKKGLIRICSRGGYLDREHMKKHFVSFILAFSMLPGLAYAAD